MHWTTKFCASLLLCSIATPQQPGIVIRSTTRLVQLSVIVHDKQGRPLTGLTKDDFELYDGGKRQNIQLFSEDSKANTVAPKSLPKNVYANQAALRNAPGSLVVILVDSLNTSWADQSAARQYVLKFLKQIQPGDRVGLYTMGRQLRVLHDFTTDATDLVAAMQNWNGEDLPNLAASEGSPDLDLDPLAGAVSAGGPGASYAEADYYMKDRILSTLETLQTVANHLANLPGRKSVIWVSSAFPLIPDFDLLQQTSVSMQPQKPGSRSGPSLPKTISRPDFRNYLPEFEQTMQVISNANVAIYPVEARGLAPNTGYDAASRSASSGSRSMSSIYKSQAVMQQIAADTGGHAFFNRNDIDAAIRSAFADGSASYTLGFYPETKQLDGKFHKLKVKLKNESGETLRYRRGYAEQPETPLDQRTLKAEMNAAAWGPMDANGVAIAASIHPGSNGTEQVRILVPPGSLALMPDGDHWNDSLDMLVVQCDPRGNALTGSAESIQLRLEQQTYKNLLQTGYVRDKSVQLERGAGSIRVVVRDGNSGNIGSVTIPVT